MLLVSLTRCIVRGEYPLLNISNYSREEQYRCKRTETRSDSYFKTTTRVPIIEHNYLLASTDNNNNAIVISHYSNKATPWQTKNTPNLPNKDFALHTSHLKPFSLPALRTS
jgi:hypothetical protein